MLDVQKICIDKSVLGEDRHLITSTDENTFIWSNVIPQGAWTFGTTNSLFSLEELALSLGKEIQPIFGKEEIRQLTEIGIEDISSVRLMQAFPAKKVKLLIKNVLHNLCKLLNDEKAVNYRATFLKTRQVLLALGKAAIKEDAWLKNVSDAKDSQKDAVASFMPIDGFAEKSIYSRRASTGRLTIDEGPMILHLKKNYRDMIVSRFAGGRVIQADYSSLEPRTIMSLTNNDYVEDIYGYISEDVLHNKLSREKTKIVVMGILYGIGLTRLSEILGEDVDVVQIVEMIRHFFDVKKLENRLLDEHIKNGFIVNHYGRVLNHSRVDGSGLISHYVQSTATEVALLGFSNIVEKINSENAKIIPIFILHDALFLDVHPDVTDYIIGTYLSFGEQVQGIEGKFPLKTKSINGSD